MIEIVYVAVALPNVPKDVITLPVVLV